MSESRGLIKIPKAIINRLRGDERGMGLVESLTAIAIIGVAVVALVSGLSSGAIAVGAGSEQATVQSLALSQLEHVKSLAYDNDGSSYTTVGAPAGYAVTMAVTATPDTHNDIQKITVTISRDGTDILEMADYKVNR